MTSNIVIALDGMGGDNAPNCVVEGASLARKKYSNIEFLFFGDEAQLKPLIDTYSNLKNASKIVHTDDVVPNNEKPSVALRSRRKSSMRLAIDSVANGDASCLVSAGNTGALMAMSKFSLKVLPGVDRPAIASFVPTPKGSEALMLDLGANVSCSAENLMQFAVLGSVFVSEVLGVSRPRVGLLNIGAEQEKGNETVKLASVMLREEEFPGQFAGYVEGDDILFGKVDVVVTDGFSGNIALKTMEGTAKFISDRMKESIRSSLMAKFGLLFVASALKSLRKKIDPRRYNGGPLLGLKGVSIKSHGGTDGYGFARAIGVAVGMVENGVNEKVIDAIQRVNGD